VIVPVSPSLLPVASGVVERALQGTRYLSGALDALGSAMAIPTADARALASMRDERVDGVIVFGFFGGASGAGRLQLTAVDAAARREGVGASLVRAALGALRADGARFVLAELPDDSHTLSGAREFLESLGFRQESRVEHFYRDGLALSFMRLELDQS
jgi:ribosomal protein S18 acetylase RimI-like enzyme